MSNQNSSIIIKNLNAIVPQNTDYQFEFSINAPIINDETSKLVDAQVSDLGEGKLISYSIDLNEWNLLNNIKLK